MAAKYFPLKEGGFGVRVTNEGDGAIDNLEGETIVVTTKAGKRVPETLVRLLWVDDGGEVALYTKADRPRGSKTVSRQTAPLGASKPDPADISLLRIALVTYAKANDISIRLALEALAASFDEKLQATQAAQVTQGSGIVEMQLDEDLVEELPEGFWN